MLTNRSLRTSAGLGTGHPEFGLYADTYEARSKSERQEDSLPAVTYWRDKIGMWLNPKEPPKKDKNGEVTQRWMEGKAAKSLENATRYRFKTVSRGGR